MDAKTILEQAKNNPQTLEKGQEALQAMLARSATDREFRQKLLTDPRAAFSEYAGREAPADLNIRFVENTATATIVLPDPVDASAELSESELESVAGGATPTAVFYVGGVLIGAGLYAIGDWINS